MRGRRKSNGLRFGIQERFRLMEPTNFDHHGPDHSGPSSRVTLPSVSMSTEEVLEALGRYTEESPESDRQTAAKLGVKRMTLTAWLGGRDRPQRCMLARLAGFLRRVGYL
jgi:transcriptional regulator with XRE-family HTH domain